MRALEPDHSGFADADGVKVYYEVFGDRNTPTILLLHGWQVAHSRLWKGQVPYLARSYRVVTFDWPGCGRSDRPDFLEAYTKERAGVWATSVMDATGSSEAFFVGLSGGAALSLGVASNSPDRVKGAVLLGAPYFGPGWMDNPAAWPAAWSGMTTMNEVRERYDGWYCVNRHHWAEGGYPDFLRFFFEQIIPEAHSTKAHEDNIAWGLEASPYACWAVFENWGMLSAEGRAAAAAEWPGILAGVRCPVLVIHGTDDAVATYEAALDLAARVGAEVVTVEGGGHSQVARDPVLVNLQIKEFVDRVQSPKQATRTFSRALTRRKRALYVSSPIGLGHARRDLAIAQALRQERPDLEIHWLAQDPVTRVLEAAGETIHPGSAQLVSESAHWESEAGEHDLNAFQALRRMDEILLANFMLFHDVVEETPYDVVIADEGWDVDYFLHENPELKRSAYCWLTDFVGFTPMSDGEAWLTSDYNAEMVEQIARYPRLRDRSIFVGNEADCVSDPLGPGLPTIRDWTASHFSFPGYVMGPQPEVDRGALGYRDDERVVIVSVGGSGVGKHLLRKVVASYPPAKRLVPELRMIAVAGPRIDPASLDAPAGVEIRGYVADLDAHLAACDLAVVQGGLTTCMELTAARRPFLYFPLANHFEQQVHVTHRLDRYRAGRRMDYATTTSEEIAEAIAKEIGRDCSSYAPVETEGALKAAALVAELV